MMRLAICKRCHEPEMVDITDLCLKCSCELNPELAKAVKSFQDALIPLEKALKANWIQNNL